MTFTELRYVGAVADIGHFGRAAARCHASRPTLGTQVRKLEATLGVRLCERAPGGHAGTLRLGVVATFGPYLVPWLVPPLQVKLSHLRLATRESTTAVLRDGLARHLLDAAPVAPSARAPGHVAAACVEEAS